MSVYFYAINQTVRNIVTRKEVQQELSTLRGQIGALEFQYIQQKNELTMETAKTLGYTQAREPDYVRPTALGQRTNGRDQL